jgi:ABC-type branched-subunit amino acid transport system ATPase component
MGDEASTRAAQLSYARQRALELAMATASGARLLLLDEPTAGMSRAEAIEALALIRRMADGRTVLLIEHDMDIVFDLADRISVLVDGVVIATGTPAQIRANPSVREAYLGPARAP